MATVNVVAVNRTARLALRDDDGIGDVRAFLDAEGDEIDDSEAAAVVIVEWRDGGWTPVALSDFASQGMN